MAMAGPLIALATAVLAAAVGQPARAEEGLWTFDDAPTGQVRAELGVRLDSAWLGHLQRASVRLTSGCSGAVVAPQGLILTSEHCIAACAESLSAQGVDYVRDGFLTDTRAEERRCPGLEAEILVGITDVTAPVFAASAGKFGLDYVNARQGALAAAERSVCNGDPALRCQVISFFAGGAFKVYKYRSYKDVRLVFAPEFAAAFFGGDLDNFAFPRFDLDFAFLRLYAGGAPVPTPDYLSWSSAPPKDGEAVFLSGNPGMTERHLTAEQLRSLRDVALPVAQLQRSELRGRLIVFSQRDPEHRRVALQPLFDEENALKILDGRLRAVRDPALIAGREAEEADLKARLLVEPALAAEIGDPWSEIAQAQKAYREQYVVWRQLEAAAGGGSQLFAWARTLVRGAVERAKPAGERLPDFAPARLALIEKILIDDKPVSADLESLMLEFWLAKTREYLGADSAAAAAFLGKEDPARRAARLVSCTKLANPSVRRALWEGGVAAIAASDDPLIAFVLATDPVSRAARQVWEEEVVGPSDAAGERIDRLRFVIRQRPIYPDATFSLRLSYGKVAGPKANSLDQAPLTTFAGLYARASGSAPFELPSRWLAARGRIDSTTVLNFSTTTDIVGGASGSPVVDARGEIVGSAFDGNLASIAGDFAYDGEQNRTISVSTAAIAEALAKVYGRDALLGELRRENGRAQPREGT
jgi:hypothetical protein